MKIATRLIMLSGISEALSPDGKCRILSLRGGGVHGAFEAGALKAMVELMPPEELRYEYVSGVSIGAINASLFSTYDIGDEKRAVEDMRKYYDGRSSDDAYKIYKNPFSWFQKDSITDNTGFREQVNLALGDKPFKRKFSILAADMNQG